MRKFWRQLRVITLITTLSLTTALPVFANDGNQNGSQPVQSGKWTFTDIIVSSLQVAGLSPADIIAAVQKVREAV